MGDLATTESLLRWIIGYYGFLLPRHTDIDGMQFSQLIAQTYYTGPEGDGPINNTAAEFAARQRGIFRKTHTEYTYNLTPSAVQS